MYVTTHASVFPQLEQVPSQFRLTAPLEQRVYLCDGALRPWDGPLRNAELVDEVQQLADVLIVINHGVVNTARSRATWVPPGS